MKNNINPMYVLLLLLGVISIVVLGGSHSFLGSVSFDDFQSGQCKIARPLSATITCAEGPVEPIDLRDFDEQIIRIELYPHARIHTFDTGILGTTDLGKVYSFTDDEWVCGTTGTPNCINYELEYGHTYRITSGEWLGHVNHFRAIGNSLRLEYSDSSGIIYTQIPHTDNCISQDLKESLINSGDSGLQNVANTIDGVYSSNNPAVSNPVPNTPLKVVGLQPRNSFTYQIAYEELAPIGIANYNGQLARCEQNNHRVLNYQQITALDGSCWVIPGSTVLASGSDICCSDIWCKNTYSSDYACQDFHCVEGGTITGGCNSLVDLSTPISCQPNPSGSGYIRSTSFCDLSKPQPGWLGTVAHTASENVECCDDGRSYPNNQCCKWGVDGKLHLEDCEVGKLSCLDMFGSDACCLDTQNSYTVQNCSEGLTCCQGEGSPGIGICKQSCSKVGGFGDIFSKIGKSIANLFGIDLKGAKDAMLIGIAIIGAIVFFFILISRRTGPPGTFYGRRMLPQRFTNTATRYTPLFGQRGSFGGGGYL